jgi:hypothetical protein
MPRVQHTTFLRPRSWVAAAILVVPLGVGALALSPTHNRRGLLDQLQRPAAPGHTAALGSVSAPPARFVRRSRTGYSVTVALTPNRANGPIGLSIHVFRHGRSLTGARAHASFSMPSMNMWNAYTTALHASAGGRYAAAIPVLGMAGDWRLRIDVKPTSGRPFDVVVNDHIAA